MELIAIGCGRLLRFVRVMACAALIWPTFVSGNAIVVGARASGLSPVPESGTRNSPAVVFRVSVPVAGPTAVGANRTRTTHGLPALAALPPPAHTVGNSGSVNAPGVTLGVTVTGPPPVLVTTMSMSRVSPTRVAATVAGFGATV